MGGAYCDMNQPKSVLAKDMLTKLNAQIPELDYNAGLCTFASYELVKAPAIYDRAAYGQAIAGLPTDVVSFGLVGNPTPLGVGLRDFEAVLKTLKGKTAVIILTDGGQNKDIDPVKVATHLAKTYDICLHILSFAQTTSEKATVEALRAVTPCTVPAAIDELGTDTARFEYLKKILFTEAPAVAAPAPAPADKDSDGDGVGDGYEIANNTDPGNSGSRPAAAFAVNVGGAQVSDGSGLVFTADTNYSGGTAGTATAPVGAGSDALLYVNQRQGSFSYNLPVVRGSYVLTLYFSEPSKLTSGKRIFDVITEGHLVVDDLDIARQAGSTGLVKKDIPITVRDGRLIMTLRPSVGQAELSAFKLTPAATGPNWGITNPALNLLLADAR